MEWGGEGPLCSIWDLGSPTRVEIHVWCILQWKPGSNHNLQGSPRMTTVLTPVESTREDYALKFTAGIVE